MKVVVAVLIVSAVATIYITYRILRKPGAAGPDAGAQSLPAQIEGGDFVVVPASYSDARVKKTGLSATGTEDMRHLLEVPKLPAKAKREEEKDYRPSAAIHWAIDIQFDGDPVLSGTELSKAFGRDWLQANGGPTVYGWSPELKHWTFLVAGDAPETFTKLCLGWPLYRQFDEEFTTTADDLERYQKSAIEVATKFGKPQVMLNRSPTEAMKLSRELNQLVEECQKYVIVVLAPAPGSSFQGRDVWDVMTCLGLKWGDGDLFHWENDSRMGDDHFFSVETTTPPGYFLPEQIAAGKVKVNDLVFGFSIPRCAAPELVLESMLRGVHYVQRRIGGTLLGENKKPLDENDLRNEVKRVTEHLRTAGFEPGRDPILYVF